MENLTATGKFRCSCTRRPTPRFMQFGRDFGQGLYSMPSRVRTSLGRLVVCDVMAIIAPWLNGPRNQAAH